MHTNQLYQTKIQFENKKLTVKDHKKKPKIFQLNLNRKFENLRSTKNEYFSTMKIQNIFEKMDTQEKRHFQV